MIYIPSIISIIEVLLIVVPVLLTVAFVTVAERKTMASMQRRLGPNIVGYWGLLQAFADALKLLLKEYVSPTQANLILFFLGPIITLIFSLLGYAVVPYGPGLAIWDFDLGILYMLAVSSLSTYGILLAGWSANSKYAFLGSLRSTAQLISYELILSSAILLVVLLTGSLNLTVNIEFQRAIWFIVPLLPVFIIFFIGSVAETNRAPFDLAEAESELVSGFMTEHAAVIFVFFFLAEYASIVLICILTSILFLGGYLLNYVPFIGLITYFFEDILYIELFPYSADLSDYPIIEGLLYGLSLGIKSSVMIFTFIWVRASFPRIRFDQLMTYSWTVLLPIVIAFIILVPCTLYSFEIIPANISLLLLPVITNNKPKKNISRRYKLDTTSSKLSNSNKEFCNSSIFYRIFSLNHLGKVLIIFLPSLALRCLIKEYLEIDVLQDYLNSYSLIYYAFITSYGCIIREFLELDKIIYSLRDSFSSFINYLTRILAGYASNVRSFFKLLIRYIDHCITMKMFSYFPQIPNADKVVNSRNKTSKPKLNVMFAERDPRLNLDYVVNDRDVTPGRVINPPLNPNSQNISSRPSSSSLSTTMGTTPSVSATTDTAPSTASTRSIGVTPFLDTSSFSALGITLEAACERVAANKQVGALGGKTVTLGELHLSKYSPALNMIRQAITDPNYGFKTSPLFISLNVDNNGWRRAQIWNNGLGRGPASVHGSELIDHIKNYDTTRNNPR